MPAKVIVIVSDAEDGRRGEVTVLDNPTTATHLIETLLEAGYEHDRIKLFSGDQADLQISSRPVVTLMANPEVEAASNWHETEQGQPSHEWEDTSEQATPYVRNGVRFSSLFRAS